MGSELTPGELRRALCVEAEENLTGAYRQLGDAADCLRGLGLPDVLSLIGEAKAAINGAKNELR